jgi:hypothetical protein
MAAMNTQLRLLLLGTALVLLNACATSPMGKSASLAGTWTNSFGTVWVINSDGTFTVDRYGKGKMDITGNYTVSGDTLTITGNQGKVPKGCEGEGVYKFARNGDNLTFTLVSDTCKDRKKNVTSPWHKK